MKTPPPTDTALRLRIAASACTDPRSVARYLRGGEPMKPAIRERIEAALRKLKLRRLLKGTTR